MPHDERDDPAVSPPDDRLPKLVEKLPLDLIARLHEFTVALSVASSPEDVARAAVEKGAAVLGADVSLFARPLDERRVELVAGHGLAHSVLSPRIFDIDTVRPLTAALKSGTPQFVESAEEFVRRFPDTARMDDVHGAVAALPLAIDTRVIGALAFRYVNEKTFDGDERALMRMLASQTAQAFDRASLFESEKIVSRRMRALANLACALAGATSIDDVVHTMVLEGMQAMSADTCMLYKVDATQTNLQLVDERGCPPEVVGQLRSIALDSAHGQTLQRELWVERNDEYTALLPEVAGIPTQHRRACAFWNMPLVVEGRVIGVLAMGFYEPQRFTADVREFVRAFAQHCAQAVGRAERAARERDSASRAVRARAEAEAANRAKDEFLAILGHELRNPLTPIATALNLMDLRGLVGAERERTVIKRQVQHLTRLVDDLLDVSRIAAGKIQLSPRPVEIGEIVARAIEIASPMFGRRSQYLDIDIPADGLVVNVDATRMTQAVANVLTNAAKYSDPKGRIHIVARRDERDVLLRVIDTGVGIEPSMLPRVFELFVQEPQALDRARGGLGLGLTIVRNIVELHGGSVAADSAGKGQGSTLSIRLPVSAGVVVGDEERATLEMRRPPAAEVQRVLVVDDNQDAAALLTELLEEMGHTVCTAFDAPAALAVLREFGPSVALLDIGLPGMDGYELAQRIRQTEVGRALRLVAVTGYGQNADRDRSKESGFDLHLVKPIALEDIVRAVKN
jgi:signal transduction histidine kinase/CheY-like chemotaxis protein